MSYDKIHFDFINSISIAIRNQQCLDANNAFEDFVANADASDEDIRKAEQVRIEDIHLAQTEHSERVSGWTCFDRKTQF